MTSKVILAPHLFRAPSKLPKQLCGGVVTLGNFDGMHLGHQHVLQHLGAVANGRATVVFSFYPHPVAVLNHGSGPRALSSIREKWEICSHFGVSALYEMRFTESLSRLSAERFIGEILVKKLGASSLVVGEDVAIGHKRQGDLAYLRRVLPDYGVELHVVPKLERNGVRPSSRRVRELLLVGDVKGAADMLGRPFSISARVGHGDKRGSQIGFPTANLMCGDRLLPQRGVYAVRAEVGAQRFRAVANIGVRPTFNGIGERLEVHLLGGVSLDLYGQRMRVSFVERLRGEVKFTSPQELVAQIGRDITAAERSFSDVE